MYDTFACPSKVEIAVVIGTLVTAAAGVRAYRGLALRHQILDRPNSRSAHSTPIPRGGGSVIALLVSGTATVLLGAVEAPARQVLLAYIVSAAALAGMSWIDDIRSLTARLRLCLQSISSAVLITTAWWSAVLPNSGPLFAVLTTMALWFWLTGWTNAFNFMDGIDGIAGTQAALVGLGWILTAPGSTTGWIGAALVGASLGFLIFNWSPATIFMGDVGSAFIGYTIAALPIIARAEARGSLLSGIAWTCVLAWPFCFDTSYTLVERWRKRENLTQAHRTHLYQRLVQTGLSHRTVAGLYGALAAGGALLYAFSAESRVSIALVVAVLATAAATLVWLTRRRERALNS